MPTKPQHTPLRTRLDERSIYLDRCVFWSPDERKQRESLISKYERMGATTTEDVHLADLVIVDPKRTVIDECMRAVPGHILQYKFIEDAYEAQALPDYRSDSVVPHPHGQDALLPKRSNYSDPVADVHPPFPPSQPSRSTPTETHSTPSSVKAGRAARPAQGTRYSPPATPMESASNAAPRINLSPSSSQSQRPNHAEHPVSSSESHAASAIDGLPSSLSGPAAPAPLIQPHVDSISPLAPASPSPLNRRHTPTACECVNNYTAPSHSRDDFARAAADDKVNAGASTLTGDERSTVVPPVLVSTFNTANWIYVVLTGWYPPCQQNSFKPPKNARKAPEVSSDDGNPPSKRIKTEKESDDGNPPSKCIKTEKESDSHASDQPNVEKTHSSSTYESLREEPPPILGRPIPPGSPFADSAVFEWAKQFVLWYMRRVPDTTCESDIIMGTSIHMANIVPRFSPTTFHNAVRRVDGHLETIRQHLLENVSLAGKLLITKDEMESLVAESRRRYHLLLRKGPTTTGYIKNCKA
ncbi:hypothetical protein AURDEDRAFT_123513 [Auricularia subglabra TFB-10046 SS5]|nr:hypothetical protein AURDEDRAFT_123513 [Auricularia subglabra TFB-10046 SS5]